MRFLFLLLLYLKNNLFRLVEQSLSVLLVLGTNIFFQAPRGQSTGTPILQSEGMVGVGKDGIVMMIASRSVVVSTRRLCTHLHGFLKGCCNSLGNLGHGLANLLGGILGRQANGLVFVGTPPSFQTFVFI